MITWFVRHSHEFRESHIVTSAVIDIQAIELFFAVKMI